MVSRWKHHREHLKVENYKIVSITWMRFGITINIKTNKNEEIKIRTTVMIKCFYRLGKFSSQKIIIKNENYYTKIVI